MDSQPEPEPRESGFRVCNLLVRSKGMGKVCRRKLPRQRRGPKPEPEQGRRLWHSVGEETQPKHRVTLTASLRQAHVFSGRTGTVDRIVSISRGPHVGGLALSHGALGKWWGL